MNFEVEHLSHCFRTDAAHLIEKARRANTPGGLSSRTSYIGKLAIDAYMACECALKSMIASRNDDKTVAEVYALILKCRHDLNRLVKVATPNVLCDEDRRFLKSASKRGVNLRYSLDLFSLTTSDLVSEDNVDFRIDQNYLGRFLAIAVSLSKEAGDRHREVFGSGATRLMSQAELKTYIAALRAACKKHGRKC